LKYSEQNLLSIKNCESIRFHNLRDQLSFFPMNEFDINTIH